MIQGAASAPRIAILQVRVTSWISFNDVFLPGVLIRVAYGSVFSHNHRRLATVFDLKGSMANFYVALPIYSLRRTPGKFLKASRMVIHATIDPNSPLDDSYALEAFNSSSWLTSSVLGWGHSTSEPPQARS